MEGRSRKTEGRSKKAEAGVGNSPARDFVFLALSLALFGCSKPVAPEVEAPAPVQVTAVTQDTIRRIVAGDGVLFPLDQQNVMPKVSAPVQKFYANRGDHVKTGQLLATLENRDLKFTVAANKGQVDQAESNLRATQGATIPESLVKARTDVEADRQTVEAAKKVLDSRQELFKEGALARRQVDEAQVSWAQANSAFLSAQEHLRTLDSVAKDEQVKAATAQVAAAVGQYQSAEAQVAYTEIRSPMNGIIADRPLYAGDLASTGQPLFSIVDISRVVARVNVPQSQALLVHVGHPADITFTDGGEQTKGTVTVVSPATDPNSTTVQVWVQIDNPGDRLKPGAAIHAAIVTEMFKAVPVVPASAILPGDEGAGTAVLVVGADSVAHLRPVQLGVREGNKVQILNGARPGEEVVVVGGLGVDDKAKVKVIDTTVKEADDEDQDENAPPAPKEQKKDQKKEEAKPKGQ